MLHPVHVRPHVAPTLLVVGAAVLRDKRVRRGMRIPRQIRHDVHAAHVEHEVVPPTTTVVTFGHPSHPTPARHGTSRRPQFFSSTPPPTLDCHASLLFSKKYRVCWGSSSSPPSLPQSTSSCSRLRCVRACVRACVLGLPVAWLVRPLTTTPCRTIDCLILGWLSKIKSFALGSPESDLCFFGFGSLEGTPHGGGEAPGQKREGSKGSAFEEDNRSIDRSIGPRGGRRGQPGRARATRREEQGPPWQCWK